MIVVIREDWWRERINTLVETVESCGEVSHTHAFTSNPSNLPFEHPVYSLTINCLASVLAGKPIITIRTMEDVIESQVLFPLQSEVSLYIINDAGDLVISPEWQIQHIDTRTGRINVRFGGKGGMGDSQGDGRWNTSVWRARLIGHGDITLAPGRSSYTSRGKCRAGGEVRISQLNYSVVFFFSPRALVLL